jgi:hypothetical protein
VRAGSVAELFVGIGAGGFGRVTWKHERARPHYGREHRERAGATGERECCCRPDVVGD